jgi:predicted dehydrogenase
MPYPTTALTKFVRARAIGFVFLLTFLSCKPEKTSDMHEKSVRLVTIDPGHFHAALVQKTMYPGVDSIVHVYAPSGPDVEMHLERIEKFNTRSDDPTRWKEEVYTGPDFFSKMLEEKKGNVVVLSGTNEKKTEYISQSLDAGYNVLADKPMVIDSAGFELLKKAFATAQSKDLLLYDIMTERYEITTILQKEFSLIEDVFGTLERGTRDDPAVTKVSVHHFYKYVSGSILTRPPWFMDVRQAGNGIVDVTTHLVDLVQWECFPDEALKYDSDIQILAAKRSATEMTLSQFKAITKIDTFPDYLKRAVTRDSILQIYCNGSIDYKIKGVHARVSVDWRYQAPDGAGDTHYSVMRGTKANLIIRQGKEQQFKPTLYIEPVKASDEFGQTLTARLKDVQQKFPGVDVTKAGKGWEVIIPDQYKEGHEAHFARVMQKYLEYMDKRNMPAWEVPNMLAKYYTTTRALSMATQTEKQ